MQVHEFTFNMYQENSFVLVADNYECVIIDPGCHSSHEQASFRRFIENEGLNPVYLLNTHGHIDHMLGNAFVKETWNVPFLTHRIVDEVELPQAVPWGNMMGISPTPSPPADQYLDEGDTVEFGGEVLEVLFTPGHSPGHISFFHRKSKQLFSGDVLFAGSIGRVDLPGGDYNTLMNVIIQKILPLGDEVEVFCGHGPSTTCGRERLNNPFVLDFQK
ncbi:MAG: MBL fold metallo-hydrolase [Bacteroidia bacterium]